MVVKIKHNKFMLHDALLKDDAVHESSVTGNVETWYYDAMLNNGYSAVTLINLARFLNTGFVVTSFFIYKNSKLVKSHRQRYSIKKFHGSFEKLYIKINSNDLINVNTNTKSERWMYTLSIGDEDNGIYLNLEKKSKAWLGKTYLGRWLVIPRFKVDGFIYLNKTRIKVFGDGYHDHNIYPIYAPFINKGYHFGKIRCRSIDVIWAKVSKNDKKQETIVVLNKDDRVILIPSEDVSFVIEEKIKDHHKTIPISFHLNVDNSFLFLDTRINTIDFHHINAPSVNYWRHHVKNTGEIRFNSESHEIQNTEIMEQLIFL